MDITRELQNILPSERIRTRYIDLISFASDAGFYQLIPKAVVQPVGEEEIIALFNFFENSQPSDRFSNWRNQPFRAVNNRWHSRRP